MIGQIPSAQGQPIPGVGTTMPRLRRELFERGGRRYTRLHEPGNPQQGMPDRAREALVTS